LNAWFSCQKAELNRCEQKKKGGARITNIFLVYMRGFSSEERQILCSSPVWKKR
jgi:hypothetical protein